MRPLIGISGRRMAISQLANTSQIYGSRYMDLFLSDFARRVWEAGGMPVHLPFEADGEIVSSLNGLVITGGQDVHPRRYDGTRVVDPTNDPRLYHLAHDAERDDYEARLLEAALHCDTPLLGICRGHQLLNVVLGGTLIEDIPESRVAHDSNLSALTDGDHDHLVTTEPDSLVRTLYGERRRTNSWHHQAVDQLGDGLRITARADDGIVEAIEAPGRPILGVQWHPEWMSTPDPAFDWLVNQASAGAVRHGSDTASTPLPQDARSPRFRGGTGLIPARSL
jgi:putative glutamine amidotransferase